MIDGILSPTTISPESQDESPLAHPEIKPDFFNRPGGFSACVTSDEYLGLSVKSPTSSAAQPASVYRSGQLDLSTQMTKVTPS